MTHLDLADLAAYFAGDHADETRVEEHLFACATCTREAEAVAAITERLRGEIPVVVDAERLARLQARGLVIRENSIAPETPTTTPFPADVDVLLHRLSGLDLSDATRVDVSVSVESTGRPLLTVPDVRFDRDAGAVLVACQRHFEVMPPDTLMEVRVHTPSGERVRRYSIMHVFAAE